MEGQKMEGNQKINCTVSSCKFNNGQKKVCELEAIKVAPVNQVNTQEPDESMCSSYENQQNQKKLSKKQKERKYYFPIKKENPVK